ncbi:MAG: polysaccharide deacetylase family protein [Dehalococcoidia bacterium]
MKRWMFAIGGVLAIFALASCGGGGSDGAPSATASLEPTTFATSTAVVTAPAEGTSSPTETPAAPAATATTKPPSTTTYEVQPGDTLYAIARRFGVTVNALAAANGLADPSQINVGQVLRIPKGGVVSPPPPTSPPPSNGGPATVVRRATTNQKVVALTFDAGSDTGFTAFILDTLKANNIKASFGITGRWAEQNPSLTRRIAQEGHLLINHTYSHASFTGYSTSDAALSRAQRWEQLDRTEAIIKNLTGATTKPYFRPPYGDYDDSVNADVGARGYRYNVMWTVDSLGWQGLSASAIKNRCLAGKEPGAIYLFHVGSASRDAGALQSIINGLRAAGYSFARIDALVGG